MKNLSIVLLGFVGTFSVASPTAAYGISKIDPAFIVASTSYATSTLVPGDQLLELADDSNAEDGLSDKTEDELKDEEMRRLYLKLLLMKGVAN